MIKSKAVGMIALLFIFSAGIIHAQQKEKQFKAFPYPIINYTPETRFIFGLGGNATFRFLSDSVGARPSVVTAGASLSQNKQTAAYVTFQLFIRNNRYFLTGEAGYFKYNYYFFGIRENTVPKERYDVNYPRIKFNGARLVLPHIYAGAKYQYEDYRIVKTDDSGLLAKRTIPGSKGSTTSGLGPLLIYDSRDTILYPSKGFFAELSYTNNNSFFGGDHNFDRYILDVAYYHRLSKKLVLAVNSYNSFVTGDAPFQQLSLLGGNKKMRGYYEGAYADNHLSVLQAELRFPVYKRFGAVAFGSTGALGNKQSEFLRLGQTKFCYGAGIRFLVNKKDHLNLRLDFAFGKDTRGAYFTVGEAF